ncbi:unnamed protein product [Meloidogyne enterolobii]|uniref:Uncharacterized protein n=1 Tax=Meloidogyne enterolobii TaxID=390850 RepID=A0ACB1AJW0_MELEN
MIRIILLTTFLFTIFPVFLGTEDGLFTECVESLPCTADVQCFKGRCAGKYVAKCKCLCTHRKRCKSKIECGGMHNSCINGRCDCLQGTRDRDF